MFQLLSCFFFFSFCLGFDYIFVDWLLVSQISNDGNECNSNESNGNSDIEMKSGNNMNSGNNNSDNNNNSNEQKNKHENENEDGLQERSIEEQLPTKAKLEKEKKWSGTSLNKTWSTYQQIS